MRVRRSKHSPKKGEGPESPAGNSAKAQARKFFARRNVGRNGKTAYRSEFADRAKLLCQKGATEHVLAIVFGVPPSTILEWRAVHEEFAAACEVDANVYTSRIEDSLAERAIGYDDIVEDVRLVRGRVARTQYLKHMPADVGAQIFWIKHRGIAGWGKSDPVDPKAAFERLYAWCMHPDRK